MQGTSGAALRRLVELVAHEPPPAGLLDRRRARLAQLRERTRAETPAGDSLTAGLVAKALDDALGDRGVLLHEAVSNTPEVLPQIRRGGGRRLYGSGGGSLGWGGGAALGIKLAQPEEDVAYLTGDGTFVFANPSAVYWGARRYEAPFLTVILNNAGWRAVKSATLEQHPDGAASELGYFASGFEPGADLGLVARSAGAHTATVTECEELGPALADGLAATRAGVAAVVDVRLAQSAS